MPKFCEENLYGWLSNTAKFTNVFTLKSFPILYGACLHSYVHTEHHNYNHITTQVFDLWQPSYFPFPSALYRWERERETEYRVCYAITRDGGKERVWEPRERVVWHQDLTFLVKKRLLQVSELKQSPPLSRNTTQLLEVVWWMKKPAWVKSLQRAVEFEAGIHFMLDWTLSLPLSWAREPAGSPSKPARATNVSRSLK